MCQLHYDLTSKKDLSLKFIKITEWEYNFFFILTQYQLLYSTPLCAILKMTSSFVHLLPFQHHCYQYQSTCRSLPVRLYVLMSSIILFASTCLFVSVSVFIYLYFTHFLFLSLPLSVSLTFFLSLSFSPSLSVSQPLSPLPLYKYLTVSLYPFTSTSSERGGRGAHAAN